MSLTVLITNLAMRTPSGTVTYTRDLALELQRQGHRPIVYTWLNGAVGRELTAAGVEVVDDLWRVRDRPDVIHGHHRPLIRGAMVRFPDVPVVAFCHNHADPWDAPVPAPQILRYVGVSRLCVRRLLEIGAPEGRTGLCLNFVDLAKFRPRPQLPPLPKRALVFSNYATKDGFLPIIQTAFRDLGIDLDVVGSGVGNQADEPELLLTGYDLVFAKAKAAMEAMAVGAAVVLCDFGGLGPMVTTRNFEQLRPLNFGFEALVDEPTTDGIRLRVQSYDPAEAELVGRLVRSICGLEAAVGELVDIYHQVIEEWASDGNRQPSASQAAVLRYRTSTIPIIAYYRWFGLGPRRVPALLGPPYRALRHLVRRSQGVR